MANEKASKKAKPRSTKITPETMAAAEKLVELKNTQRLNTCHDELQKVLAKHGCKLVSNIVVASK